MDCGYVVTGASDATETRIRIGANAVPDVLLTEVGHGNPAPGIVLARECLAAAPMLRVIYLISLPWSQNICPLGRERLLPSPFTEQALAAILAAR